MSTLYTISRCRADDTLYGPSHGSDDGDTTLCGQAVGHSWYIIDNTFSGEITCKKCLKVLEEKPYIPQRIL